MKTENVRFRTANQSSTFRHPKMVNFESQILRVSLSERPPAGSGAPLGQYRRPKLACGSGFPHDMGGTRVQMSRKQQHSSTSRICPTLLFPITPRARLRLHHEPMESDSDGIDYESLASVLAVGITKPIHNLSRRGQGQSVSWII